MFWLVVRGWYCKSSLHQFLWAIWNQAEAAELEYRRDSEHTAPIVYSLNKFCQPRQRRIKEIELTIQDLKGCPRIFFETLLLGARIY